MKTYRDYINNIDENELREYYLNHTTGQTKHKFNVPTYQIMKTILKKFNIEIHNAQESSKLLNANMTEEQRRIKAEKVSNAMQGHPTDEETRKKISLSHKGKKKNYFIPSTFKKGNIPWNKGKKGVQHWTEGQSEKYINTKRKNGTLGKFKTLIEKEVEKDLINKYGEEHVYYQYKSDKYPFMCDFYVDTEDLYVEVNHYWTHGPHPFDKNNPDDLKLLKSWKSKSAAYDCENQYDIAIRVWTCDDTHKLNVAKENNLNYITIYPNNLIIAWLYSDVQNNRQSKLLESL